MFSGSIPVMWSETVGPLGQYWSETKKSVLVFVLRIWSCLHHWPCTLYTTLYPWRLLDSQLTMSVHVFSLCQSAYYQLRQLRSLSVDVAKPRWWSRHSCHHGWTTATASCSELLMTWWEGCRQSTPERRRTSDHRRYAAWPHYPSSLSASLAVCQSSSSSV